jgi:hypothetical protein
MGEQASRVIESAVERRKGTGRYREIGKTQLGGVEKNRLESRNTPKMVRPLHVRHERPIRISVRLSNCIP